MSEDVLFQEDRSLACVNEHRAEETRCPVASRLKDEAFDKLEHIPREQLLVENVVEVVKESLIDACEPVQDHRVGKIMARFSTIPIGSQMKRLWNTTEIGLKSALAGELQGKCKSQL